jgi:hypothetical protein
MQPSSEVGPAARRSGRTSILHDATHKAAQTSFIHVKVLFVACWIVALGLSRSAAGQGATEIITVAPNSIVASAQTVGTTGSANLVRVTNAGRAAVDFTATVLPSSCSIGDVPPSQCLQAQQEEVSSFLVVGGCNRLDPGHTCSFSVLFSPVTARKLTAFLFVQSSASFLGQVELSGTGIPGQLVTGTTLAVEFYNQQLDHYFITELPAEIEKLDSGAIAGWERTGYSFWAWPNALEAATGTSPTCRFYRRPESGLDSHFYSAAIDECQAVLTNLSSA